MLFTRRHYIAIASIIKERSTLPLNSRDIKLTVEDLISYFEKDNELFDKDIFLEACGMSNKII